MRAQVVAQVDSSTTEQATENYTPGSQIVRSEQQSQTSNRDASQSGGVPGALSNEPPASGVAQPPPPNKAPAAPRGHSRPGHACRSSRSAFMPLRMLRRVSAATLTTCRRRALRTTRLTGTVGLYAPAGRTVEAPARSRWSSMTWRPNRRRQARQGPTPHRR